MDFRVIQINTESHISHLQVPWIWFPWKFHHGELLQANLHPSLQKLKLKIVLMAWNQKLIVKKNPIYTWWTLNPFTVKVEYKWTCEQYRVQDVLYSWRIAERQPLADIVRWSPRRLKALHFLLCVEKHITTLK